MQDAVYTARFPGPRFIVRNVAETIELRVYRDGALVTPSAVTVSVYDANKTAVVDAQSATVSASVASYTIPAATTADLSLGQGWLIKWTATVGGQVINPINDAALVRRQLYPVVTDLDLFRRASSLDPSSATVITSLTTYQSYLDEAFLEIQNRLINTGRRPNLVISPYSLRDVHLYLTLALIFEDLSTRLNEAYELRAQQYRSHYERCWGEIKMLIDTDDSGEADDIHHRSAANPTVWLGGRGGTRWLP